MAAFATSLDIHLLKCVRWPPSLHV